MTIAKGSRYRPLWWAKRALIVNRDCHFGVIPEHCFRTFPIKLTSPNSDDSISDRKILKGGVLMLAILIAADITPRQVLG